MGRVRFSFTNFVSTATVTPSTEDATYVAANIKTPQRPFLPWRTTALGDQYAVIDFLSAKTLGLIEIANVNVATIRIQGNASDAWASPSYSVDLAVGQNPLTGRYQHAYLPSGFSYRYMRVFIPDQVPLDGAAYYSVGGVWAGTSLQPPVNFLADIEVGAEWPILEVSPPTGAWIQQSRAGEPYVRMTLRRIARVERLTPMVGDRLNDWLVLDRQMRAAAPFALFMNAGDAAQGYVVQLATSSPWRLSRLRLADSELEVREAMSA